MKRVKSYTITQNQGCHSCYHLFIGLRVAYIICLHIPLAKDSLVDPKNKGYENKEYMEHGMNTTLFASDLLLTK